MDIVRIFEMVTKGVDLAGKLISAGRTTIPQGLAVLEDIKNTFGAKEEVTKDDLDALEARLDEQLDAFNEPLPPGAT